MSTVRFSTRRAGHVDLLVVAEEEQPVLDDRAAEVEAELVLADAAAWGCRARC